ncbi:DUF4407 domain-containing protein [Candidatus Kaistella beijingensis]|uniref:DUF4407 domain-containing protein n=1 Tax=Candidatus Kaistella beijingensis TaxID=2820270 RepID=UPI001CC4BEC6|nr:DUF4407 domain-containing protein [Candidatus Kaistella beijingensis]UBB89885.1 DUF4407 domain-containing protein [Candidatus Kaistella beijingensis]
MSQKNSSFHDFFLKFSGEDFQIIKRSRTSSAFVGIGVFVFVIFMLCFVSSFSFLYNSFDGNIFLSAPVGVFWGLLIATIYVFLIYTITPILLPTPKKKKNKIIGEIEPLKFDYNISFFLRLAFIIFLAIIVAQPLNVLLLKQFSERTVEKYKIEFKLNEALSADSLFVKKELTFKEKFAERSRLLPKSDSAVLKNSFMLIDNKVDADVNTLQYGGELRRNLLKLKSLPFSKKNQEKFDFIYDEILNLLDKEKSDDSEFLQSIETIHFADNFLKSDFDIYKKSMTEVLQEKTERFQKLDALIEKSNFYVTTMRTILAENPVSWLISFLSIMIFSLPIYIKYRIGKTTEFFKTKQNIELKFVQENYEKHLETYKKILTEKLLSLNADLKQNLEIQLERIRIHNVEKSEKLRLELKEEISELFRDKYQFWKNPPFRTQKTIRNTVYKTEKQFLEFIYGNKDD